ncbi:hypothetical protein J2Y69_003320 [Microbacterium resistens]|uniref:DGQHR domain-containing protein n=1 Tax=Microbacterium resistens TaxID=156977 RepID=A0ABU1SGG0_9MICO|nr:hypothetical protein [Microbacterium resistens]MDR6868696.1 hypothetical protein [Microbacterium resistens]
MTSNFTPTSISHYPEGHTVTISTQIIDMTPEQAERLLAANVRNRNVRPDTVKFLAAQMKAGAWRLTHQGVAVATDGVLLDGQHRLYAVVEAGVTVPMLLTTGIVPEAMTVVDTGARRSFADVLKMKFPDLTMVASVAAATAVLAKWDQGARGAELTHGGLATKYRLSHAALLAYYEEHAAHIQHCVTLANRVRKSRPSWKCPSTVYALIIHIFEGLDIADAAAYFEHLRSGAGLDFDHPILAAIRWADRLESARDKKPGADVWAAIFIKAWNKYRDGDKWTMAIYRKGGAAAETFPEPR